ncbi:MAG: c-type cytochrome [Bacteroidales bacterium]|nr:c-type cytochrome [Bacteroidales bacterium]
MQLNRILIASITLLIISTSSLFSQTTSVPSEAKNKTAPFLFTPETIKTGEQIFNANCKSCHGDPGKANYAKLNPIPKDPASPEYQKNSDGEMFYILSNGRGLMPNFVNTLNEAQRWQVISYIRSFNKSYKQPPIKSTGEVVKTETAKMILAFDKSEKKVFATITDSVAGLRKPLPDITIKLFVKRTFGSLLVAEASTGKEGIAYFNTPADIPGDSLGFLSLIAKTQGNSKELISTLNEKLGVVTKPKNLLDQRAWWNVNKMAPVWLIISYLFGVVGIGITVVYILLQLRKIKKINDSAT